MIVTLIINLTLAALLWYMGPISNHRTFGVLALSAPDQMLLLGLDVSLALIGAALRITIMIYLYRVGSRSMAYSD